jgi:bromodomain adjacent to zinc finger domain protein 1A
MPLLHKQRFAKKPVPTDIDVNTEIFYSKLTQEVFVDYELVSLLLVMSLVFRNLIFFFTVTLFSSEYFERTILCNSLVWTCALSGKTGLTYSEALHSEEKARLSIISFPRLLEKIILFLTLYTKRGNIKDLLDDVFIFMKDRYFIGETVSVVVAQSLNSR